ncbi:NAD-P-binding protein [Lentinus tigrinus ALCF2SS1-7]|uniref:NAD-P-binding protein n=1 Tax=Lentinus tigrinus ALCF2SS1-6 TaxID=1328759 RepID=A0A5C2RT37_9APHY|nr:NAD-P-binding protein [Lentinus tigrinus ALCF2SS1-6]RPD76782.1 NAD-P-binding protein [Lentinus tigrinus ALCF2SS1-7]
MTYYAVIGASRGIGLEYVRQLAARPDSIVLAVVRNAAKANHLQVAIKGLNNVHVLEADVTDYKTLESATKAASDITGGKLNYLIHSAARVDMRTFFKGFDQFATIDEFDADVLAAFKTNALGMIHTVAAFLPLLQAGSAKKIVILEPANADPKTVRAYGLAGMAAHHITKASSLMAMTKWAVKLQDEGFVVVALNPGVVDTTGTIGEHGDPAAHDALSKAVEGFVKRGIPAVLQTPQESVSAQLKVIDGLKSSDNGLFLDASTGKEYTI